MLICFSPSSSFGDIITKDGVKIQFFKKGQKKSISKDVLNGNSLSLHDSECLDKIVFTKTKNNSPMYSLKIFNSNNELILRKSYIYLEKNKGFVLPIYPWIVETDHYKIEILEGDNMVLSIEYEIFEDGYTDNEN